MSTSSSLNPLIWHRKQLWLALDSFSLLSVATLNLWMKMKWKNEPSENSKLNIWWYIWTHHSTRCVLKPMLIFWDSERKYFCSVASLCHSHYFPGCTAVMNLGQIAYGSTPFAFSVVRPQGMDILCETRVCFPEWTSVCFVVLNVFFVYFTKNREAVTCSLRVALTCEDSQVPLMRTILVADWA